MIGYIKLHRRIVNWEWFDDDKAFKLFVYILVKANWEDTPWEQKNMIIRRGELVTSLSKLSKELGYSVGEIRHRLNNMQISKQIALKSTNKYTIITVCNYDDYQDPVQEKDTQNRTQTARKSATSKEERIEEENIKKKNSIKKRKDEYQAYLLETDDRDYHGFVKYLFGNNELGRPFEVCLSKPKDQIDYKRFKDLMAKYPKEIIKKKILAMEVNKKFIKEGVSFNGTLHNWCKSEIK